MSRTAKDVGSMIAGKYRVVAELGEGGMGVVFLAVHEPLGVKVAVKVLSAQGRTPADEKRFLLEAQAAAQMRSPHIARVTDFGALPDGRQFMVMEHLEGQDLGALLETRGRMTPTEAADYVVQACAALVEAHAIGIIHRDLKPTNLFVTPSSDGTPLLKVLDFGVSKFSMKPGEMASITTKGLAIGTPLYMSPEQVKGQRIDTRADIWALGVVLYELLSGQTPFFDESLGVTLVNILDRPHTPLQARARAVPHGLSVLVDACLSKQPEGRPGDVVELASKLEPFASPEGKRLAARLPMIRERAGAREHLKLTPSTVPPSAPPVSIVPPSSNGATGFEETHLVQSGQSDLRGYGHAMSGHAMSGHAMSGHAMSGHAMNGLTPDPARTTEIRRGRGVPIAIGVVSFMGIAGALLWFGVARSNGAPAKERSRRVDDIVVTATATATSTPQVAVVTPTVTPGDVDPPPSATSATAVTPIELSSLPDADPPTKSASPSKSTRPSKSSHPTATAKVTATATVPKRTLH